MPKKKKSLKKKKTPLPPKKKTAKKVASKKVVATKAVAKKVCIIPEVVHHEPVKKPAVKKSLKNTPKNKVTKVSRDHDDDDDTGTGIRDSSALVSSDPLAQYLNEIRKYPLLTREEEHELAVKYFEKGDKFAAEKLVTSNLRFVVKISLEYAKMGAKLMDIVQEGNVGLMHAVKEYNPYKGVKLITYAVWWIRGYIREYLMKQYSMVKIGTTQSQKKLFYNLEREKRKMQLEGKDFTPALLGSRLGVSEKDVKLMDQRMRTKDLSLDTPVDDENPTSLLDLQSGNTSNPESELEVLELIDLLKDKIEEIKPKLNPKELDILENRVLADEPQTLQEIGDRHGITRERARQLEERLLKNLKDNFLLIADNAVAEELKK